MVDKPGPVPESPGAGRARVGIFLKQPRPGAVKTRLCPPLSATEAAAFYTVAQQETVTRLAAGPWQVTLVYAGQEAYFRERYPQLPLLPQGEGDLGRRLARAEAALHAEGGPVVLVGSDAPDLPLTLLSQALALLADADAVAAPAADGGYVLLATAKPRPQLFRDIPWSGAAVLAVTRRRAATAGLAWRELAAWEDVDDFPSLLRLLERSPHSASAAFVRSRLSHHLPEPLR